MNKRFIVPGVSADTTLFDAAPALLLSKAEPLFELEAAARSGADADAVHDMRVASRRLREAMRLLASLYPPRDFRAWYRRVRHITRVLGPVRDSDVFIEDFAAMGPRLGDEGRRAVAFMVGYRAGRREHELVILNTELAGLDLKSRRRSLEVLARTLANPARAGEPLAVFAHAAVAARAETVFGAQPAALAAANVTQQHELRIHYKRLRYAVEVFAPCYNEEFDALHEVLTAFQDTLGDLHDMHVFLEVLREVECAGAAEQAGVSREGFSELELLIESRVKEIHARFVVLAGQRPAEILVPQLLRPLVGSDETYLSSPDADERVWDPADAVVVSPVTVGDEPWAEGWDGDAAVIEVIATLTAGDPDSEP